MYRTAAEARAPQFHPARPTAPRAVTRVLGCATLWGAYAAAALCAGSTHAAESQAEIQINLCSDPAQVVSRLKLAETGKPATVWLFDTATQELHRGGLRLRLRERGKRSELTLKAAGLDCAKVDPAWLKPDGKCESDLHGDSLDDVVSLTRPVDRQARAVLLAPDAGRGAALESALGTGLDARQRELLAGRRHAAAGAAPLPQDIARLGPSTVKAYQRAARSYLVEVWTLPRGEQFVELSQKVRREVALARRVELLTEIAAKGVVICTDQDSQAQKKLAILAR
jgi:hypothetical protein